MKKHARKIKLTQEEMRVHLAFNHLGRAGVMPTGIDVIGYTGLPELVVRQAIARLMELGLLARTKRTEN